jgi:hypothetical protein
MPAKSAAKGVFKVPSPQKTTDYGLDRDYNMARDRLQELVNGCLNEPSLIDPLYDAYRRRCSDKLKTTVAGMSTAVFSPPLARIVAMSDPIMLEFIPSVSDLAHGNVATILAADPALAQQLIVLHTQISFAAKPPPYCQYPEVHRHVMTCRGVECGNPLASVKAAVSGTGEIDWGMIGRFTAEFDDETKFLKKLTHRQTGHFVDVGATFVSQDWPLYDNFYDLGAYFQLNKTTPKISIHKFFDKKHRRGPHALDPINGAESEHLKALAEIGYQNLVSGNKQRSKAAGASDEAKCALVVLKATQTTERKRKSTETQSKVEAILQERKAKRAVKYT